MLPQLPFLAPGPPAMAYGNRRALAQMARVLARDHEAARWDEDAETLRAAIFRHCFDETDLCFYDRDADEEFVRVRGDVLGRVLCEHVADQELFEAIYARHIRNPGAFRTPFSLPSIAANDAHFVRLIPPNSWGGALQALTALRAPRWFSHYGKHADLRHLTTRWLEAITRNGEFRQQIDPWSGDFTPAGDDYSPTLLCALDFITRLYGVRREAKDGARVLAWSCAAGDSSFELLWDEHRALVQRDAQGCALRLDGHEIARVVGECEIISDESGNFLWVINTTSQTQNVAVKMLDNAFVVTLAPDERRAWNALAQPV
jgi:hypothetical protein